jgi:hypothetical protein
MKRLQIFLGSSMFNAELNAGWAQKLADINSSFNFPHKLLKNLLILILSGFALSAVFAIPFYFWLGTKPEIVGEVVKNPALTTPLDFTMQKNPKYNTQYVYLQNAGYVLKD